MKRIGAYRLLWSRQTAVFHLITCSSHRKLCFSSETVSLLRIGSFLRRCVLFYSNLMLPCFMSGAFFPYINEVCLSRASCCLFFDDPLPSYSFWPYFAFMYFTFPIFFFFPSVPIFSCPNFLNSFGILCASWCCHLAYMSSWEIFATIFCLYFSLEICDHSCTEVTGEVDVFVVQEAFWTARFRAVSLRFLPQECGKFNF